MNNPDKKFILFQFLIRSVHSYTSPLFNWTRSWLYWRTLFVILHTDNFWAQSLTTSWILFFVDNPDQKFLLFRNLLGRVHSYSSTHFIWPSSWPGWRTLFVKLHTDTFFSAKFDNDMGELFVDNPDHFFLSQILLGSIRSYSGPRFIWKVLTRLKNTFCESAYRHFLSAKFDNDMNTFFRKQARSKNPSISEPTRTSTLLLYPSFHLTKFLTRLKNTFRETAYRHFFERKIWQRHEWVFRWQHRYLFFFQILLGSISSYSGPRFIWTSPWLDWWNTFCETAYRHFFERKVWQRHGWTFRWQPRSFFFLSQILLGSIRSYSGPRFIW